jgi:cardiolipin synthase
MLIFFQSVAWDYISLVAIIIAYIVVVYLIVKTLLQNRNPITTLSWIIVLILIPFMGLFLYFLFGQKITKRWIFKRMRNKEILAMNRISRNQLKTLQRIDKIEDEYLFEYHKLISLLLNNNSSFLSSNNHLNMFHNGHEVYSALFEDLKAAKKFIHLEYYILENGKVVDELVDILVSKSEAGIEVCVIMDGIGSRNLSNHHIENLKNSGIEVLLFRPVRFPEFTSKINNRNHRKIVVIDGKIGYTGGINVADKYLTKYGEKGFWRDTHLRISGDSVKMLEAIFLIDKLNITKKIAQDLSKYFPNLRNLPGVHVQIASSNPESGTPNILQAFFMAINTAKSNIRLISPYFIPDESLLMALKTAANAGVRVEIILPGIIDSKFVQYSARSYVQQLLRNNVQIYFYQKGFIHAKILIVDELLSIVGTSNFDYRSFYQNFEISALIYDKEKTLELIAQFEKDKSDSEKLNLSKWRKRPINQKLFESLARLYAPLI